MVDDSTDIRFGEGTYTDTTFKLEAREASLTADGEISMEVWSGDRDGPTIWETVDYELQVDGATIDRKRDANFEHEWGEMRRAVTLSGGSVPIEEIPVPVTVRVFHPDAESATLSFELTPESTINDQDLSVECDLDTREVRVGERVTVTAVVENTAGGGGVVDISVALAGEVENTTEFLSEGDSTAFDVEFEMEEPGEYGARVEVRVK